jgi:hypothetical protein
MRMMLARLHSAKGQRNARDGALAAIAMELCVRKPRRDLRAIPRSFEAF